MNENFFDMYADDYNVEIKKVDFNLKPDGTLPDPEILKKAIKAAFKTAPYFERKSITYDGITYPPAKVLWVSDLIFCAKRKVYELIAKTSNMTEESIVKTAIGNLAHREIQQKIFAIAEFEKKFYKHYKNKYLLVGRVDCLLNNVIIDFKIVSKAKMPKKLEQYYEDQLQLYMWLADTHFSYLVMINTLDGNVEVFLCKRNDERINQLLDKGIKIVDSLATYNFPEPEPTYPWMCQDCIVKDCQYKGRNL